MIDDPEVITSPMLNPFSSLKKKTAKTPKGGKKGIDGPGETSPDNFDRRNGNLIKVQALNAATHDSIDSEQAVFGFSSTKNKK